MILKPITKTFHQLDPAAYICQKDLVKILDKRNEFKGDLISTFNVSETSNTPINVGNAKFLVDTILSLDSMCDKIDIKSRIKDIELLNIIEAEKALFEILSISNDSIIKDIRSNKLTVETRYSSKTELLDIYNFNKFATYCHEQSFQDLIQHTKEYLLEKNRDNPNEKGLRIVKNYEDNKYYLRAVTSPEGYQDFGINFSVFVALVVLSNYVESTKNELFVNNFSITESNLYASFLLTEVHPIEKDLNLVFNLILENDEIKRSAVSFNGQYKLTYSNNNKQSHIYIKPKGLFKEKNNKPQDLLKYAHRGNVENVFKNLKDLPLLIDQFIEQAKADSRKISKMSNPDDIRKFLSDKVKNARKEEFLAYKPKVFKKLMNIQVNNIFKLFDLLREVEDLFDHEDIVSRDFWRSKIYESLIEKK